MAYVELIYNGLPVSGEWINLLPAAPGIFTLTSDGNGQGAILNQDSTQNSSQRPEAKGRVVQMFGTGAGAELLDSLTGTKTNPGTGNSAPGDASAFMFRRLSLKC